MKRFNKIWQISLSVLIFYSVFIGIIISKYNFNLTSLIVMTEELAERYPKLIPENMVCFTERLTNDAQAYYLLISSKLDLGILGKETWMSDRFLYILLGYLLSLGGKKPLIHYAMLFINMVAILAALYFMYKLLKVYSGEVWLSAVFACNIGHMIVIQYLLSEALAIAFLTAGLYFHHRQKSLFMCIFFALSWLCRSATAMVVILPFAFYLLCKKKYREFLFASLSILPYALYQIFLYLNLGYSSLINQFKTYGSVYGGYSLPFSGLCEWVKRIEFGRRGLSLLWEFGVMPFIIFILLCIIYGIKEFLFNYKRFNIYKFVFLILGLCCMTMSYQQWSTIASCGRLYSVIFVFLFLSHATAPKDKFCKLLIYLSLFMSLLGIIRAITYPRFDYILSF